MIIRTVLGASFPCSDGGYIVTVLGAFFPMQ